MSPAALAGRLGEVDDRNVGVGRAALSGGGHEYLCVWGAGRSCELNHGATWGVVPELNALTCIV